MTNATLLLPDWQRCIRSPIMANGVLARWWSHGNRMPPAASGFQTAIRQVFVWPGNAMPAAALSRQFDVGDAAGHAWMRADPAHVRADMTTARMLACGELGLSEHECSDIARDLKPLFGDAGFEFEASLPNCWYLRALIGSQLPECASPDEVMGDDLKLHLPEGAAGRRWRQLFNDSQILLHNHPVNAARIARGAVSVNSLWFWGAGVLPDWVRSDLNQIYSDRVELRALSGLAGIEWSPLQASHFRDALVQQDGGQSILIDLSEQRDETLETGWLLPLDDALRRRRLAQIDLVFTSGQRHRLRPAHGLRFWRRVKRLAK